MTSLTMFWSDILKSQMRSLPLRWGERSAGWYMATESQWDTALEDWERRCGIDRIEGLKESLAGAKRSFEGLAADEREKISKYQAERRSRQLTDYLERFRIRNV